MQRMVKKYRKDLIYKDFKKWEWHDSKVLDPRNWPKVLP